MESEVEGRNCRIEGRVFRFAMRTPCSRVLELVEHLVMSVTNSFLG